MTPHDLVDAEAGRVAIRAQRRSGSSASVVGSATRVTLLQAPRSGARAGNWSWESSTLE